MRDAITVQSNSQFSPPEDLPPEGRDIFIYYPLIFKQLKLDTKIPITNWAKIS